MTDASSVVRSLLIYGICLPIAIFLGYMLATPMDTVSFAMVGMLFGVMLIPMFLHWHHFWLIASWNLNMLAFFLPGRPALLLVMCAISFTLSVLQHIMNKRMKFLYVPTIAWPLFFMALVVLGTSTMRGGIHLNIAGSNTFGGKRYLDILAAIIGFFALTAKRIPTQKVGLYIKMYFLGALTMLTANLAGLVSPSLYFLFLIFPTSPGELGGGSTSGDSDVVVRLGGVAMASMSVISFMLAYYGIKGIFLSRKGWRMAVFIFFSIAFLAGGFRSLLIGFIITFSLMFYMERLHQTVLMPLFFLGLLLIGAFTVAFSDQLPRPLQRSLSFLPVHVDPVVERDAKDSTDWRVEMWKAVIPEIPNYLILGKGYSFDQQELEMINSGMTAGGDTVANAQGALIAGDYHNGPLSVVIPLGIWGVVAFIWVIAASIKVLRHNYKFGDPAFEQINRFLLVSFIAKTITFFLVFGSIYSDMMGFVGLVGMSIAINGGMCRAPASQPRKVLLINKSKLAGAFQ